MTTSTDTSTSVVGRFAPTPSGRMHLGNVFTMYAAWLAAHASSGTIKLRIEDLDQRASNPHNTTQLIEDLRWLGLTWEDEPIYQSQRQDIYRDALQHLQATGHIFPCFCTRAELHVAQAPHTSDGTYIYPGTCRHLNATQIAKKSLLRKPSQRLRVPSETDPDNLIHFVDAICGAQTQDLAHECGDFIVQRSDGVFAYQLAVVVDDAAQDVTQVVRGRDLLGSVGRQYYLQKLLGLPTPQYAHVPLIVAPDGRRLSKRDKDLDMGALRARGIKPHQILGQLAFWLGLLDVPTPIQASDMIDAFSWDKVSKVGSSVIADTQNLF